MLAISVEKPSFLPSTLLLLFSSLLLGRRRGIRASNLSNLALMSRTRHASPRNCSYGANLSHWKKLHASQRISPMPSVTALVMTPKSPSSEGRESRAMATIKRQFSACNRRPSAYHPSTGLGSCTGEIRTVSQLCRSVPRWEMQSLVGSPCTAENGPLRTLG